MIFPFLAVVVNLTQINSHKLSLRLNIFSLTMLTERSKEEEEAHELHWLVSAKTGASVDPNHTDTAALTAPVTGPRSRRPWRSQPASSPGDPWYPCRSPPTWCHLRTQLQKGQEETSCMGPELHQEAWSVTCSKTQCHQLTGTVGHSWQ